MEQGNCGNCGGYGYSDADHGEMCDICEGTGWLPDDLPDGQS